MRLVQLANLQEDARLARDIVSGRDGAPLLRAGVALSARFIEHLGKAGIQAVWVDDELGRGIDPVPVISPQTRGQVTRALAGLHEETRRAVAASRTLDPEATDELSDVVDAILQEIEEHDARPV